MLSFCTNTSAPSAALYPAPVSTDWGPVGVVEDELPKLFPPKLFVVVPEVVLLPKLAVDCVDEPKLPAEPNPVDAEEPNVELPLVDILVPLNDPPKLDVVVIVFPPKDALPVSLLLEMAIAGAESVCELPMGNCVTDGSDANCVCVSSSVANGFS